MLFYETSAKTGEGVKNAFTILIEEAQTLYNNIKTEKQIPPRLQSGRSALYETELADEPGYQYVLDIFV